VEGQIPGWKRDSWEGPFHSAWISSEDTGMGTRKLVPENLSTLTTLRRLWPGSEIERPLGGPSHWSASLFLYICFLGTRPGLSARWVARVGGTRGRLQVLESWEGRGQAGGLARPSKLGLQRRVIPRAAEAVPTTLETSHCLSVRRAGRSRDEGMWPLPGFLPTPSAQVSAAL